MPEKRKSSSSAQSNPTSKTRKTKTSSTEHASAKATVAALANDPELELGHPSLESNDDAEARTTFLELARYARSLEEEVEELKSKAVELAGAGAKSPEAIEAEAGRLADVIVRGIQRLMAWKPSCKTNSAKFVFDGLCSDPLVFGAMFNLNGPPKFKQKKYTAAEIQQLLGPIEGSAMYNYLYLSAAGVNVRYNKDSGEFKISGTYGISPN